MLKGGRGVVVKREGGDLLKGGGGFVVEEGGGEDFFFFLCFWCWFSFYFWKEPGLERRQPCLALKGGNLKNQKSWRGVGGEGAAPPPQIHVFNNPLPFPFSTTPRPPLTNPPPEEWH